MSRSCESLNQPSDQVVANPDDRLDAERTKLSLLRDLAETKNPSSKEVDDATLRRFLRARDMDVEKACAMFLKYLNWKQSFLPNGTSSVSTHHISTDISHNKVFLQGTDRTGRPVAVAFGGRHFLNKLAGVDEFKRYVVYVIEKLCASMAEGQEKFVVIGDLEGWGYANSDIRGYLAALHILQDYYPERLGKLFIVHVPYVFMAVWKVIYPFIDTNTKRKIVFVDNKKLKSTLVEDIDESQLPEIYGGKLHLVPIHQT
ncbi:Phosphatidylinositol transfer protein 3 [Linum grandiflorum]